MRKNLQLIPWLIVFLALIATALSFLDRMVLPISIIEITKEFPISDVEYGFINTGFLIGYAIMFTVGGIFIDRYGSRLGLFFSVGIWSFATMLHSVANNVYHFGIFRFLLGLGEGGAFPGAIKAVVEWIPKDKRAIANGIAIGGSAIGAVIAPPLSVYLIAVMGWRGVFIFTSIIGFLWLIGWMYFSRKKYSDKYAVEAHQKPAKINFLPLLKRKQTWVFIAIRFMLDPIFYFYMFWIPKYLNEVRGANLEHIGKLLWIPFFMLGISNVIGGLLSDKINKKTKNINLSRKVVMGVAALLTMSALFVDFIPSYQFVIVIMVVVFFAHGLWITNYITAISDIFGKASSSTVVGMSGSAGAISSFVINPLIGLIISRFSYDPMWIYAGVMYMVMFLIFILKLNIKELNLNPN